MKRWHKNETIIFDAYSSQNEQSPEKASPSDNESGSSAIFKSASTPDKYLPATSSRGMMPSNLPTSCLICAKAFSRKFSLDRHMKMRHKEAPTAIKILSAGPIEEASDLQPTTAIKDLDPVPENESTAAEKKGCKVTPETAADYANIIRGSNYSGLSCPICNADFTTKFALMRHIEVVHCGLSKTKKPQRTANR